MNRVELIGRLASDVDLKFTPSGLAMGRVSLAVDRPLSKEKREQDKRDKKPTADFPRLLFMGKTAENASKYLKKGALIAVEGSVRTSSYENAEGQKVYSTEFLCERIHFLEQNKRTEGEHEKENASYSADEFEIEEVAF